MPVNKYAVFLRSIKGKIIIASAIACFALLLAWGISRVAFKQMLSAVEKISAPNDKLRLVNDLTHKVARLDQLQKSEMLNNPENYISFFKETKKLLLTIDTLQQLYAGDPAQVKRINSLKKLLTDRDKLFINYLKVREGLVNNKDFSSQVKQLNSLVNKSAQQNDSTVTTTEKKTSTTTIYPADTKDSIKDSRGFFSKLFGKKKPTPQSTAYKVVDTEFNVKHDTLARAMQDSIIQGMSESMRNLEKGQLRRSALFVNRENTLNRANNKLIRRILIILRQVQTEAVAQIELNNSAAKHVVNTSISRISIIILVFFVFTIVLMYLILADIARSNRYRKELELARDEAEYHGQAKHRFLSNMSHEIRTPLQSIIGYADLIRKQEHPRKQDIDAIYHSSGHLMQIVNEVLDYNRIISGKFTFTNQVFSMGQLLDEVVSVLSFQAAKKAILLVKDYHIPDLEYIDGDPFRLKQVLYNIIGNALKFTNEGEVRLSVLHNQDRDYLRYTFKVTDTGIGMTEKDLTRIFNEFEQVDNPLSNQVNGTGLGLTISKALIETQGGSIDVKSKPGQGSSFTFGLSYKKAAMPVAEPDKQPDVLAPAAHYDKVWIIDDDKFILDLCSTIFDNNHIPHKCFNSPAELLNTPFDSKVKFILMDIRMPEMNGTELCGLLRKQIPADVMIYALTAQVMPGERETVLNQGFDGLLMKPFKEQDLLMLITPKATHMESMPVVELDISKIEKMTFGDKRQLTKILKRFTEDCIDDIAELRLSMGNHETEKVSLLTHRIAGRTAQIGAGELAAEFRMIEMELLNNEDALNNKFNDIILLTEKLQNLVKQIRAAYLNDELLEVIDSES
jgi:signal transduction histidine kinase/CheY-like chemotaxis protein/CHASE3 domain sensor protein